jgi:CRISPR-associated protein Csm1
MEQERGQIYLAALLHDIGKFYQRADTGSAQTSRFLNEHCKDESTFCPQWKGNYTHKHVLRTAQFIDGNRQVFQKLLNGAELGDFSDKNSLIYLAAAHHLAEDQLSERGRIIKKADSLSAGMDRSSDSDKAFKDDQDETSWDALKKKRMTSILQTIKLEKTVPEKYELWHLPVEALQLSKSYFPQLAFADTPDYTSLWNAFDGEFKFIQANSYHAFSESLLNLLFKYTACIPASTINFPDVSLYDHLKTTAAIAVCLYDIQQKGAKEDGKPFLLIGADFSGIQNYIYQIVSKYAAKNLKGRSFYLHLLSDAVVRYLLKKLKLFQANIIYNSGGSFYLLAPNTKPLRDALDEAVDEIEKHFFAEFGTSLFLAIDSVAFSEDALMHRNEQDLGKLWGELFKKRDAKKSCRYASLMTDEYEKFFEPLPYKAFDAITGEPLQEGGMKEKDVDGKVNRMTHCQIELGKALRDADVMVVSEGEIPYWKDKLPSIEPASLGFRYYFLSDAKFKEMKAQLQGSADKVSVVTLNGEEGDCDFLRSDIRGTNNIYGLEFYGGNDYPITKDKKSGEMRIMTFDEMAEGDEFSRLGVLRMDVDNLGSIFQKGIDSQRATLSRYAALSRSFDYFFSGYLNTIWKEIGKDYTQIIYSGGDDLFIVGRWDLCIQMAKRIREDFREYTCKNPAFSISGGLAIVGKTFPVMKGSDESETEEHHAKEHAVGELTKNAFSFMDTPLNWDTEFPAVEKLKADLVKFVDTDKALPHSFLSKLMLHAANADMKKHNINKVKTYWMLTYDLSRLKGRYPEANQLIDRCIREVCSNNKSSLNGESLNTDYHPLELWAFAARWAELEIRTNNKSK